MRLALVLTILLSGVLMLAVAASQAETADKAEQLRAELALVKMKLKSAEKKLADDTNNATSSSAESERKPRAKPISDLTEILKTLPEEAQPNRDGSWSNASAVEAEERLQYAVWGLAFQRDLEIRQVTVKENPELANDRSASPWLIEIDFKNETIEYRGASIKQDIASLKIYADDRRADRARKLEAGDDMRIRGRIVSIRPATLGKLTFANPSFYFYLRDVEIPGITR